jgi:hypothetical protein
VRELARPKLGVRTLGSPQAAFALELNADRFLIFDEGRDGLAKGFKD